MLNINPRTLQYFHVYTQSKHGQIPELKRKALKYNINMIIK